MNLFNAILLLTLAALWGASFLFMKIGVPEFGPFAFMFVRTLIASLVLLPLLKFKQRFSIFLQHWKLLLIVGVFNTGIPFILFAYAILTLTAGTTSILNATTPMFGALIGYLWLKDQLSMQTVVGLIIGFAGVVLLVVNNSDASFNANILPSLAVLGATACYGWSANFTKRYLTGVNSVVFAAGSQLSASLFILPFALLFLPKTMPSQNAWLAGLALGIACTGLAYVIFFKLIENLGPAKAVSVTYLIPFFGVIWGALFLNEQITVPILVGGGVILFGVATANEVFKFNLKAEVNKPAND